MFRAIITSENRVRVTAPAGDKVTLVKGWIYKDGDFIYTVKKKHPHYEETQAARDSVDLKKIYERYKAGDVSALDRVNGIYLDTVSLPRSIGDLYDAYSNMQDVFMNMPIKVREKYDNNPAKFFKAYGTETFDTFMNDYRVALGAEDRNINTVNNDVNNVKIDVKKEGVTDEQKPE